MFSQIAPREKLALCWGDSHCPPFLSGKKSHPSHCVVLLPLTERTSSSLSNPCPSTVCRKPAPQKHPFLRSVLRIEVFASTWGEHTCRAAPQSRCVCTSLFSCNVLWLSQNTCHRAPVSGLRVIFHQMGPFESRAVFLSLCFSSLPSTPTQTRKKDLRSSRLKDKLIHLPGKCFQLWKLHLD